MSGALFTVTKVAVHLHPHREGRAYFGYDPLEPPLASEDDQGVDIERYAFETKAGTLLGFQVAPNGSAVSLQRRGFDTIADFAKAGVVLLVRPEDGDRLFRQGCHGTLLSLVAETSAVAGEDGPSSLMHGVTQPCVGADRHDEGLCEGLRQAELIRQMERDGAPADTATFQSRVQPWLTACFGDIVAGDREERNHRFLEEALELVQACGCTASEAHQLVDYVFDRPVGEPAQEVGGVMVTLAALCLANDLDLHADAERELARVWTKVEAIRAKQAAKPKHSPLPQALPGGSSAERFRRFVERVAGWTEQELAVVDARQTRHVAQVVLNGVNPVYPSFAPEKVDRLSGAETARANGVLDEIAPLSVSSTWDAFERRTIVRAMLMYGDIVAAVAAGDADRRDGASA